jgi:adenine-specific DNA-methyltransferase
MPTLHWIGKEKVVNHHRDVPFRVLEKEYEYNRSADQTSSENKIIHGDNLEALKSLLPEYEGRVNCIYIDPPYNTGNESWVYNDNVNHPKIKKWLGDVVGKEGEDLTRHDKWLCMMYPRLKLLHKLLAKDGAIFISIDDNEQANLKLICDEIFGEQNFVDTIVWQKIFTVKNSAKYFSDMHEYVVVYSKSKQEWKINLLPRSDKADKGYSNPDQDYRGSWTTNAIQARNFYDAGHYEIKSPKGKVHVPPKGTSWRVSKENFQKLNQDGRIWWGLNGESIPRIKKFLSEAKEGIVPSTFWTHKESGQNAEAKSTLRDILTGSEENLFNTPKPVMLLERIIRLSTLNDAIVLDSFAGSGTTAHAILNLNKADGGNRKFILIEMEDYASTITAERVKRVIDGYGEEKKVVPGTGGDFAYYQLGATLFDGENNLNAAVSLADIHNYIWYSETRTPYQKPEIKESAYFLGSMEDTAYYFVYERDRLTTLDFELLSSHITFPASQYIIYADNCLLPAHLMEKYRIIFKKIPRDITRF